MTHAGALYVRVASWPVSMHHSVLKSPYTEIAIARRSFTFRFRGLRRWGSGEEALSRPEGPRIDYWGSKGQERGSWGSCGGVSHCHSPHYQLGGLRERCKLPQRGLGRSPISHNWIWWHHAFDESFRLVKWSATACSMCQLRQARPLK